MPMTLEKAAFASRLTKYRYLDISVPYPVLISTIIVIRSQEVTTENPASETHANGNPITLTVINEYFEIIAVFWKQSAG